MILLGSTGSIGTNALKVATAFGLPIESLSAGKNIALFNEQIRRHRPKKICILDSEDLPKLDMPFIKAHDIEVFCTESGLLEMIESSQSTLAINALVGYAGLAPSLKIKQCGKKLALANKESLVSAGWLFAGYPITPIDSEHFGLWYLHTSRKIHKLYITASGGALRDMPLADLPSATPAQALKHPNWSMGQKITIDSATMVNKLFEVLEAYWLFGLSSIDAFIEEHSAIHALVEFVDGSITAHISHADMQLPIAYALDEQQAKCVRLIPRFDIATLTSLRFSPIDVRRYPVWELKPTLLAYPKLGIVLNASNEVALRAFLDSHICFGDISACILQSMRHFESVKTHTLTHLQDIKRLDSEVRAFSASWLGLS
ncbi:1-deoxy-D-xylulose-5-phosphate reductoisomerase [uncultured Helicobacter sp.]|uniref:1-deoxy-D-xylulose-5-phosphate reductoisomerase n=1 Tax=uncultured Helicobacter sp. TaxID=175537 RepID=UPI0037500128